MVRVLWSGGRVSCTLKVYIFPVGEQTLEFMFSVGERTLEFLIFGGRANLISLDLLLRFYLFVRETIFLEREKRETC